MSFIHLVSFRVIALGIGFFFPIKLLGMPLTSSRLILYGTLEQMLAGKVLICWDNFIFRQSRTNRKKIQIYQRL
mgnify:CR=1 FL=1